MEKKQKTANSLIWSFIWRNLLFSFFLLLCFKLVLVFLSFFLYDKIPFTINNNYELNLVWFCSCIISYFFSFIILYFSCRFSLDDMFRTYKLADENIDSFIRNIIIFFIVIIILNIIITIVQIQALYFTYEIIGTVIECIVGIVIYISMIPIIKKQVKKLN